MGNGLANRLFGAEGSQTLDGGAGNDTLTGGAGADTFRISSPQHGADRIADFSAGVDRLELENAVFTQLADTGNLAAGHFVANITGTAVDADDYIVYETDTGRLFYDADGSGSGASVLIATLTGVPDLSVSDIFIT